MSPEQARGEKAVDKRTDVYALGAILFEILSQKMPHPGDSPNAILHHIATQPAVPLEPLRADVPAELVAIVGRALASDPAARPASAGALAQELAPFARREVWPAAPETSAPHAAALASTSIAAPEAAGPAERGAESKGSTFNDRRGTPAPAPRRASRAARVALGGAVLVAAAIAVAMGIGLQPTSVPPGSEARSASPPRVDPGTVERGVTAPPPKMEEKPAVPRRLPPPREMQSVAAGAAGPGAPADRGRPAGRPGGRPARRPERAPLPANGAAAETGPPPPAKIPTNLPPTFDPANPYR